MTAINNFDNQMHCDLTTMINRLMPFLKLAFRHRTYSLDCVNRRVKELKTYLAEQMRAVSQETNAKVVTYVQRKR